jgi:hypothetical protein
VSVTCLVVATRYMGLLVVITTIFCDFSGAWVVGISDSTDLEIALQDRPRNPFSHRWM